MITYATIKVRDFEAKYLYSGESKCQILVDQKKTNSTHMGVHFQRKMWAVKFTTNGIFVRVTPHVPL